MIGSQELWWWHIGARLWIIADEVGVHLTLVEDEVGWDGVANEVWWLVWWHWSGILEELIGEANVGGKDDGMGTGEG